MKHTDFFEYKIKNSDMKIQALSDDILQNAMVLFSQKLQKCQIWVFEQHIKMDYVQNLRKTLQSQNWVLKMFYMILHAPFLAVAEYWNL